MQSLREFDGNVRNEAKRPKALGQLSTSFAALSRNSWVFLNKFFGRSCLITNEV